MLLFNVRTMSDTINLKRLMSLKYDTHSPILINILKAENARNVSPGSVIRICLILVKDE